MSYSLILGFVKLGAVCPCGTAAGLYFVVVASEPGLGECKLREKAFLSTSCRCVTECL